MFIKRLLTACILIPVVLWVLFYGHRSILIIMAALLLFGCGWEFQRLIFGPPKPGHIKKIPLKIAFMFGIALITLLTHWFFPFYWALGVICWIYLITALINFPENQYQWGHAWLIATFGLILLPLCVISLSRLYLLEHGKWLFLYFLCLVWSADTGAYVIGKLFGKHKLIPSVSPGKTVEGLLGGFIFPGLLAVLVYFYSQPEYPLLFISQWIVTVVMCMVGDLTISMFKRRVNCKDTGFLLPGHGGLLDRLDSLIAAAPVFLGFQILLQ